MATTIKLKNSVTTTNTPTSLAQGEVAINITDKKVWVGNAATTPVQLLGAGGSATFSSITVTGVSTFSAGTVSAPSITTSGDTNTGIFFPAADTIAFTEGGAEAMRIDSSGNVGIGTSSPNTKLDVVGDARLSNTTGNKRLYLGQATPSANDSGSLEFQASNTQINWAVRTNWNVAGALEFCPSSAAGGVSYTTPSMLINSSGNVGIGTSSVGLFGQSGGRLLNVVASANYAFLQLQGASGNGGAIDFGDTSVRHAEIASLSGSALAFYTNGTNSGNTITERMRILSGGSVCINTTAAVVDGTSRLIVSTTTTNGVAAEFSNNTSGTCAVAINNSGAATSTLVNWVAANAYRAAVTWNGTNIIYGTPSDQRLKENIVDASSALPLISNIKIRSFDFKENGKHIDFGVIAQELVSVVPEAVLKGKDNEDGSIKESWSVDTSTLVPALIKAVQELNAKVVELEAKLNAK